MSVGADAPRCIAPYDVEIEEIRDGRCGAIDSRKNKREIMPSDLSPLSNPLS